MALTMQGIPVLEMMGIVQIEFSTKGLAVRGRSGRRGDRAIGP